MFERQADSSKRLNLLYDDVEINYHVITNLAVAMAKNYVCSACQKSCRSDVTHVCVQTFSDCMVSPPCAFSDFRFPVTNVIGILEVGRVSPTTGKVRQR